MNLEPLVPHIARKIGVKSEGLCLCGSGNKYKDCCSIKNTKQLLFLTEIIEKLKKIKFATGTTKIPKPEWEKMLELSSNRLKCLFPNCSCDTVDCHLIPKNVLRDSYKLFCKTYQPNDDTSKWDFYESTVKSALTEDVFCKPHDNDIFLEVEQLEIDPSNEKHQFLLAFKVIAFALRHVQVLIGIDFASALERMGELIKNSVPGNHHYPDISDLHIQYIRYTVTHDIFQEVMEAYDKEDWGFFLYFHKKVSYSGHYKYAAGFINPANDLEGDKIGSGLVSHNLTSTIFTKGGNMNVFLACRKRYSNTTYKNFFDQLYNTDDTLFKNIVNNIMTLDPKTVILSKDHINSDHDLNKIHKVSSKAKRCLKGNGCFDWRDSGKPVAFFE